MNHPGEIMRVKEDRSYAAFLTAKTTDAPASGPASSGDSIHPMLYPFQRQLTAWALRKGRSAIFADCGLGKTFMQLEWARLMGKRTLIIAPLAVAQQTVREGQRIDVAITYARDQSTAAEAGITITNYEMVQRFAPTRFNAVVLDESSILKSLDGKTRKLLTEMFAETPFRLCCTATPAPNDIAEIANHAEFLGILTRQEMLSRFFVHDDEGWRLKGHASADFYRWLASWGMSLKHPSDLGFDDEGFNLPPLEILPEIVPSDYVPEGQLLPLGLKGITDRSRVRRGTLAQRVERAAGLINGQGDQWVAWVGLNDEGRELKALIPGACLVEGSQSAENKAAALLAFTNGEHRVLITKPSIAGFGMNFQNAHNVVFVGLSDSYEAYYQCIRRCWRFGQHSPVNAHIVLTDLESAIYDNVRRKEQEAENMSRRLLNNIREFEKAEIGGVASGRDAYAEDDAGGEGWRLMLGDCVTRAAEVPDESVDLSVFSPPFLSLYVYSPSERDVGNNDSPAAYFEHMSYLIRELLRVTKSGRNCAVHVAQVAATQQHDGFIGLKDFRGDTIRAFIAEGWNYHGEVCIDKDPQAQAIRTHSKGLLFVQLHKDSSWVRPGLADYILVFRKPGENAVAVKPDITNDQWIEWARPIWYGIKESDTLNVRAARANKDERHIVPLQLGTIERVVRLWSNRGEMVFSPFAGIGSEGYVAIQQGRQFTGIELKAEYYRAAITNLQHAAAQQDRMLL